jgi:signal transduction histidine kinase
LRKEQLQFDQLVFDLSMKLLNLSEEKANGNIEEILKRIAEFLSVDQVSLCEMREGTDSVVSGAWETVQSIAPISKADQIPWCTKHIRMGEGLYIADPEELGDEGQVDKQYLQEQGMLSFAAIPLTTSNGVFGCIAFATTRFRVLWNEDLKKRLWVLAGLFSNALARRQAEAALLDVSRRLITAHEEERTRIARDLHDDLSQRMAVVLMGLEQLTDTSTRLSSRTRSRLRHLHEVAAEVSAGLHNLSHQLHPSKLETLGLVISLDGLCRDFANQHHLKVRFLHDDLRREISEGMTLCLFRIVQEALRNVVKHSGADEVTVELSACNEQIEVCVSDSGVGFDPESAGKRGLGLTSMRERLRLVGGQLQIESQPSKGTRIHAYVPLPAAAKPRKMNSAGA